MEPWDHTAIERGVGADRRGESARVIATLTGMVGEIGLAEEFAQDALVSALEKWPEEGVPRKPGAWQAHAGPEEGPVQGAEQTRPRLPVLGRRGLHGDLGGALSTPRGVRGGHAPGPRSRGTTAQGTRAARSLGAHGAAGLPGSAHTTRPRTVDCGVGGRGFRGSVHLFLWCSHMSASVWSPLVRSTLMSFAMTSASPIWAPRRSQSSPSSRAPILYSSEPR